MFCLEMKMEETTHKLFFFFIIFCTTFLLLFFSSTMADPIQDKQALLDFLLSTPHSRQLNWNNESSICESWSGVVCSIDNSTVTELHLPGFGFRGPVPPNTISKLSSLCILSLRFNFFSGPLPRDFSVWKNLTLLDLSNNAFNGSIPASISALSKLTSLNLANNSLSGEVPDFDIPTLKKLNLSNNHLTGVLPHSLERFPLEAFAGNNISSEIPPAPSSSKIGLSELLEIVLGCTVMGFAVIGIIIVACCSSNRYGSQPKADLDSPRKKSKSKSVPENKKFVFFEGFGCEFGLEELLKSSAEVLGKGVFGPTYKAALEDGTVVVVKRVTEMAATRAEFRQLVEAVGGIRHENVAPLRGYYCLEEEKMLVYDYYVQGSVSSMLHGERVGPLDWETRLKIAIGVARGVVCIHRQNDGKLVHGNLKGSNIFLNSHGFGFVSDTAISTLMDPTSLAYFRAAGYLAPEVTATRKVSQESDVYSFGVLILELLTGKSPVHNTNLVQWVNSVVQEKWSVEVFDLELLRCPNIEDELIEMLRIGIACVARNPEQRPKMPQVLQMVDGIRQL